MIHKKTCFVRLHEDINSDREDALVEKPFQFLGYWVTTFSWKLLWLKFSQSDLNVMVLKRISYSSGGVDLNLVNYTGGEIGHSLKKCLHQSLILENIVVESYVFTCHRSHTCGHTENTHIWFISVHKFVKFSNISVNYVYIKIIVF